MSHHFDTPTAKEDPRINLCDFYLFDGAPGTTVMAMTVNPDAGLSAPDTFRDEALYAFRFDLNGDAREELSFKFSFGEAFHPAGDNNRRIQDFQVRMASGADAVSGPEGEPLIDGETSAISSKAGIRAFAGLAPDLFAGDAVALHDFLTPFYKEKRYHPGAFVHRQDFFARRNVSAIVLEVPNHLIGEGKVNAWATISLVGHAPQVQVSRWCFPLITHIFLSDPAIPDLKETFNRSVPSDDVAHFSGAIGTFAEKMSALAGSAVNPSEYGKRIANLLCPTTLPYRLGTAAAFDYAGFNGRALGDDAMDVMLTLATNMPLGDGVAPDRGRTRAEFPYFGEPFTNIEQEGVTPAAQPTKK